MAVRDLGTMKPDELSKMTALELLRYNSPLPVYDPDNPWVFKPFPCFMYTISADGSRLQSAFCRDQAELDKLQGDWRPTIAAWGLVTHPEVPRHHANVDIDIKLTNEQRSVVQKAKKEHQGAPSPAK